MNMRIEYPKELWTKKDGMGRELELICVEKASPLKGTVSLLGAKNAVLVIMSSLILTDGVSILHNVPASSDVLHMINLLTDLGAVITFERTHNRLTVDTSLIHNFRVRPEIMKKMRASILVMSPLLARFGKVDIALPGGCLIGPRPIDFHLKNLQKMGVIIKSDQEFLHATCTKFSPAQLVLEYPSVGATENIVMAATLTQGTTRIINASLEPEVLDLIAVLQAMGAQINILPPATLEIQGVSHLKPIEHTIIADRLEAGGILLAAAVTGGSITITNAQPSSMEVFLAKLEEMGHSIATTDTTIVYQATQSPQAVSFRTGPYPGFPTDLQAPMMMAQCLANGKSVIHETVFENRFLHVRELQKLGAQIDLEGDRAFITGVDEFYGTSVIATDIRASCALVLAGLAANGKTFVAGVQHWRRGYENLEHKLTALGASVYLETRNKIG